MAMAPPAAPKGKGTFSRLPKWAQIAVPIGGAVLAYVLYKRFSSSSSSATTSATSGAIDPATGVPYATELAAAQAGSGSVPASGGGYSGGGGSGGGGNFGQDLASAIASGITTGLSGTSSTSTPTSTTSTTGTSGTTAAVNPDNSTSASTGTNAVAIAPAANLTPQQATAEVGAGVATPRAALAAETPASQETAAQRHAQEVANKPLRAALK
jgi:hypothetical protein